MERHLKIYSEALLSKLKDYLYDYYHLYIAEELKRFMILQNEHKKAYAWRKVKWLYDCDHTGINLDHVLSVDEKEKVNKVDKCIDSFLFYLCTDNVEKASLSFEKLLDDIIELGESSRYLSHLKKLHGILAATIIGECCSSENTTLHDAMGIICVINSTWYTQLEIAYLLEIFYVRNEYDCMHCLLIELVDKTKRKEFETYDYFFNIFKNVCEMYLEGVKENGFKARLKDGEKFIKNCEIIFDEYQLNKNIWSFELANNLFAQRKYEESKKIWESLEVKDNDLSMLYNRAITYAWAASEKENEECQNNIKIAMDDIKKGIKLLGEYNEDEDKKTKKHRVNFYLEKSFLLTEPKKENTEENTERDKYNEAYNWLKQAYSIAKNTDLEWFKRSSNYNTHLWIISQYLKNLDEQSKPDEQNQSKSDEFNSTLQKITILNSVIELDSDEFSYFPAEYRTIFEFVRNDEYLKKHIGEQVVVCKHLLFTLLCAQEIKHASKIRDVSQYDLVYYTKLSNLKLLLEDEEKDQVHFRTPLFHAYHMNDPQEGKILDIYLRAEAEEKAEARFTYEENYVFLKSYFSYPKKENGESQLKEFLPMWVQYGDEAQGCCVVLNAKTFEGCDLRRISYLDDDGNCVNDVTNQMNEILKDFEACYKQTKKESNTIMEQAANLKDEITKAEAYECVSRINQMLKYIVSLVSYLFKHESYKHENEVRLIKTLTPNDLDQIRKIPGNVPKTYIYNDTQTYIDEIILGSKVSNPEDFVPFLCIQGRKMWDGESKEQITISHSAIQYR